MVKRSYPKADLAEWTGYPSSSLKRRSSFGESLVIMVEFYQNKALAGKAAIYRYIFSNDEIISRQSSGMGMDFLSW